jgi:hypothetical protein
MWDTTALNWPGSHPASKLHRGSRIPYLAKNERDMGHPSIRYGEKSPGQLWLARGRARNSIAGDIHRIDGTGILDIVDRVLL